MASVSDINATFSTDKGSNSEPHQVDRDGDARLSEAEQYADDLARQLIRDTDQLVNKDHSGLMDFSTDAIETSPALTGTDFSISEQQPAAGEPAADSKADQDSLSRSPEASKPSAIVANIPVYFEEDSLNLVSEGFGGTRLAFEGTEKQKSAKADDAQQPEDDKENCPPGAPRGRKQSVTKKQRLQTEEAGQKPHESGQQNSEAAEDSAKPEQQEHELAQPSGDVKEATLEKQEDEQVEKAHEEIAKEGTAMEFTKNYSDDLLMDQRAAESDQRAPGAPHDDIVSSGGPDLADFELPPYSGSSSSGSEQAAATTASPPSKQKAAANSDRKYSSSTTAAAASSVAVPDLNALKKLVLSSYSQVSYVFHWKNPIESGVFFATGLTVIIALTFFSIISVVAYGALGVILASGLLRLYKSSMKTLNRPSETPVDHIWEKALNLNVSMSAGRLHELVDSSHANINSSLVYIKQVLLVEDKLATFKFGFILYLLTYIGAWFNGLTLITICYLSLFSIPLVYEKNKTKIDEYFNLATGQICSTISMVTNKVTALAFGSSSGDSKKQN